MEQVIVHTSLQFKVFWDLKPEVARAEIKKWNKCELYSIMVYPPHVESIFTPVNYTN